jgi:hypothetical protein
MHKRIPSPEEFLLEVPLYEAFEIDSSNFEHVRRIEFFQGTLDTYCIDCAKDSVFARAKPKDEPLSSIPPMPMPAPNIDAVPRRGVVVPEWQTYATPTRIFSPAFECTRVPVHKLRFFVQIKDAKIMKIGQYPSLADLQGVEIKKYRKTLGDAKYAEFNRAIGLSAHGVGIGAFVYLRRIFESLFKKSVLSWVS